MSQEILNNSRWRVSNDENISNEVNEISPAICDNENVTLMYENLSKELERTDMTRAFKLQQSLSKTSSMNLICCQNT